MKLGFIITLFTRADANTVTDQSESRCRVDSSGLHVFYIDARVNPFASGVSDAQKIRKILSCKVFLVQK